MGRFYFKFYFFLVVIISELNAVDNNNTQVPQPVYEQALNWENLQERNGILFDPNAEQPLTGFIKKIYANSQVQILFRLTRGQIDQVSRWLENGIPLYSVEVILGSISI